jgi:hypothetical protein
MKFQLKALAAALALAAVAVPAQASIDANNTGNGSFILTVLDKVANVSATFDLGKNYSDFSIAGTSFANSGADAKGVSFSWDLAGNADYSAAWTSFLSATTLANTTYAIMAGDNLGSGAGSRGYITTYTGASTTTTTTTNLLTALGNADTFNANIAFGATGPSNMNTVENGAAVSTPATIFYGSNKNNGTGIVAVGAIGTSLGVVQAVSASANLSQVTNTVFGNDAKFTLASNGSLTYVTAPVPEADTWAMMMVGLGLMGFMARRRNRN